MPNSNPCACPHPLPVQCASLQGHNVFVYCGCICHDAALAAAKPKRVPSPFADHEGGEQGWPKGEAEC